MIVVDASALIAVIKNEPEGIYFSALLTAAARRFVSAVSLMESSFVLAGRQHGSDGWSQLDAMVSTLAVEVVAFDRTSMEAARDAFLRYGKGRHPAALNMGDCASYALAMSRDLPLLFKGNDFSLTDVRVAA